MEGKSVTMAICSYGNTIIISIMATLEPAAGPVLNHIILGRGINCSHTHLNGNHILVCERAPEPHPHYRNA